MKTVSYSSFYPISLNEIINKVNRKEQELTENSMICLNINL